jgi:hypothetical protein
MFGTVRPMFRYSASSRTSTAPTLLFRRGLSDKSSLNAPPPPNSTGTSGVSLSKFKSRAELEDYLRDASKKMEEYNRARELKRQGKLKSKNEHRKPYKHTHRIQLAIAGSLIAVLFMMPKLCRKIVEDDEFREKWVPKM